MGFGLNPAPGKDLSPPSAHLIGDRVLFNFMAEGAKGDGKTNNTEVILFLHAATCLISNNMRGIKLHPAQSCLLDMHACK
jgi:hypothetical protein